jgi:hypothetical protein
VIIDFHSLLFAIEIFELIENRNAHIFITAYIYENKLIFFFSSDETAEVNGGGGAELQVNGSESLNQKYSQILGDHHTNYTTQLSNKSSSSSSQSHQIFKARSYNNKENYFNNQRSALRSVSGSRNGGGWHRGTSANYRATAFKDTKREGENIKPGSNGTVDGTEPIKFNEGVFKLFSFSMRVNICSRISHLNLFQN